MDSRINIETITFPTDARGLVIEPIGADRIAGQRNVHLVITEPGCVRGNHYHRRGTEITLALGPGLFRYRTGDSFEDILIPKGQALRFTIPPGVGHAFQNTGDAPMILLGFNTEEHNSQEPDVVRDILIPV